MGLREQIQGYPDKAVLSGSPFPKLASAAGSFMALTSWYISSMCLVSHLPHSPALVLCAGRASPLLALCSSLLCSLMSVSELGLGPASLNPSKGRFKKKKQTNMLQENES